MVLDSLLRENTHFNQDNIQCEAVTGYEGETGMIQSMIESVQGVQEVFNKVVDVAFMEAAAENNVGTITESTVEALMEADAEQAASGEGPKADDTKSDSKGSEGIGAKIIGFIKKAWAAFINAINNVIATVQTYLARDLKKFVANFKPKSDAELEKITLKKFKRINTKVLATNEIKKPDFANMSKEQLTEYKSKIKDNVKTMIKEYSGLDASNIAEYTKKAMEEAVKEESNVKLSTLVDDAKMTLSSGKSTIGSLKDAKKKCNKTYKESIADIKTKAKSVKKSGSYTATDGENKTEVKVSDRDLYAVMCNTELAFVKETHNIYMAYNNLSLKIAKLEISQAKAVLVKAAAGKIAVKESFDEADIAEDQALIEYCEYDTEVDMDEIQDQIASGEIEVSVE